jgi:hypothetical protein
MSFCSLNRCFQDELVDPPQVQLFSRYLAAHGVPHRNVLEPLGTHWELLAAVGSQEDRLTRYLAEFLDLLAKPAAGRAP